LNNPKGLTMTDTLADRTAALEAEVIRLREDLEKHAHELAILMREIDLPKVSYENRMRAAASQNYREARARRDATP
jgi:hypothetical protein